MSNKKIIVELTLGHYATRRERCTIEGYTHDWEVYVRSDQGLIQAFVDQVIFHLHESFAEPRRVLKAPPFRVSESGYAGFMIGIEILFKNNEDPGKAEFKYDMYLQSDGPSISPSRKEIIIFNHPSDEFAKKLFEAGGIVQLDYEMNPVESIPSNSPEHQFSGLPPKMSTLCQNCSVTGENIEGELETVDLPPPPFPEEIDSMDTDIEYEYSRFAFEMIDSVRHSAEISHEKSQIAVYKVIHMLKSQFDNHHLSRRMTSLLAVLDTPSAISQVPDMIETCADAIRLRNLFNSMSECKDDEQQRSWAVHEDALQMGQTLEALQSILNTADPSISKHVMKGNRYVGVQALALLYQMETRQEIRTKLRDVFISICKIDCQALFVLTDSVLPMELAREFKECPISEKLRVLHISRLLVLLLSTREPLPIGHYVHLGLDFVVSVCKMIEVAAEGEETLPNELTNFILTYNLQFKEVENNYTVQAMEAMEYAPFLTQRFINLLNWGNDPLDAEFPHEPPVINSTYKILIDIFSSPKAAQAFYTNDIFVLIDIIIRWLTDIGPGDVRRHNLLTLIRLILRNSCYMEHNYRKSDLDACFTRILQEEEEPESVSCQRLVENIYDEFPMMRSDEDDILR